MGEVCINAFLCMSKVILTESVGGVQNIGKKEKEAKKDRDKGKGLESDSVGSDKKEKKSIGIRGIRGFV